MMSSNAVWLELPLPVPHSRSLSRDAMPTKVEYTQPTIQMEQPRPLVGYLIERVSLMYNSNSSGGEQQEPDVRG